MFRLSDHAERERQRRGIPKALVESVVENPQQIVDDIEGMRVYQSQLDFGAGKMYLLRVFVVEEGSHLKVVTLYRTSKIRKYWRRQ